MCITYWCQRWLIAKKPENFSATEDVLLSFILARVLNSMVRVVYSIEYRTNCQAHYTNLLANKYSVLHSNQTTNNIITMRMCLRCVCVCVVYVSEANNSASSVASRKRPRNINVVFMFEFVSYG